jgi:selenocysteine lyase/cysteine desulfurase
MDKRSFIKKTSLLGVASLVNFSAWGEMLAPIVGSGEEIGKGEDFWATIRKGYHLKPDYINLENGYYCFPPAALLEKYMGHIREVNLQGAYYMRTVQFDNKKAAATKLATLAGCSPDELIITRNTTESLDMIISGMDWKPGDEAVMAEQDYSAMLDMFKQTSKRYGMMNKIISVPMDPKSDDEIVALYEKL